MLPSILKVFVPSLIAFSVGILITPSLSSFFRRHRLWKRSARGDVVQNPGIAPTFQEIHDHGAETSTPRIGGVIIWLSILVTIVVIWALSVIAPTPFTEKLNFLSRNQTLLPLFALVAASLIGLADDLLQIYGSGKYFINGISRLRKILIVGGIGLIGALWFYFKLDVSSIAVPFSGGELLLGWLFIPFFIIVVLATFSSSVIDGLDGLAGGVLATNFGAFATIAYFQNQIDIAVFCLVIAASILAFLWFNIPPARFYMGETGIMGLTVTLAIVAFLTDQVLVLPIVALPLVATSLSSLSQMIGREFFGGRKPLLVAPLHHHFQALGWPHYKVTMRYWVIATMCSILGIIVALIG
jgi:phospho-N-acetylmuramoyl-pentapeptide-transferase